LNRGFIQNNYNMKFDQTQTQKQILKFSPQQIQLLNLLQLNSLAIEQRIKDEIEENPALEEGAEEEKYEEDNSELEMDEITSDIDNDLYLEEFSSDNDVPYYKTLSSNSSKDEDEFQLTATQRTTFQDQLKEQIQSYTLDSPMKKLAHYVIDSLDEDGYLRTPVTDIANYYSFAEKTFIEEDEVINIIKLLQLCEPPGVAARNLKECLVLQLQRKKNQSEYTNKAITLLEDYFHEFSNKNYEKIIRETGIASHELQCILKLITHLNPKPIANPGREDVMAITIIPEFQVIENNGIFEVLLTNQQLPELRLSKNFMEMIEQIKEDSKSKNKIKNKAVVQFAKQKINSAKWFIDAIQQRQSSMLKTMKAIVHLQEEFFLTGDFKNLKPMILKDVAKLINMDISTVSRVTSSKYVQTSFGVYKLKEFFTSVLKKEDGEEISNKEIQEIITELVQIEDKKNPLTDLEISAQLKTKGYNTARRTVAKYREHIGIPIARMRKQLL
jgi:RNA polymerase sigma-54 factor